MVVPGIIHIKSRKNLEVFSPTIRKLWKEWGLRCMILQSLVLQIILIFFGNRRKVSRNKWIHILLWGAYLMADKVATVALVALMDNIGEVEESNKKLDANTQLTAFWAPFLLLHLGGPDTITAYSLEDNELWLRHLLELGVQTGVAMYVFLLSWTGSLISSIAIPMFFVGIIKYGERTWCLKSASFEEMKEYIFRDDIFSYMQSKRELHIESSNSLIKANYLFNNFKRLFVDFLISFQDLKTSQSLFKKISFVEGFEVVGFELGFMYDLLYTKRRIMFTSKACWLRLITFITTCIVLVLFSLSNKSHCSKIDVAITFLLLVIAVLLELYATVLLVFSDWMILRLYQACEVLQMFGQTQLRSHQRWSNSLAQYSFLSYSIKRKLALKGILLSICRLFNILQILKYQNVKSVEASGMLKDFTFSYLKRKCEGLTVKEINEEKKKNYKKEVKGVLKHRGDNAIRDFPQLKWSVGGEFERSVLIWHLATALLQAEENKLTVKVDDGSKKSEARHEEKETKDDGEQTQASNSEQKNEEPSGRNEQRTQVLRSEQKNEERHRENEQRTQGSSREQKFEERHGGNEQGTQAWSSEQRNEETGGENEQRTQMSSSEIEFEQIDLNEDFIFDLAKTRYSSAENEQVEKNENYYKEISKLLSRYMMYLLVMCPSMVPTGVGKFKYDQQALGEASSVYRKYESLPSNTLKFKNIITSWVSNLFKNRNLVDQFETRACEMLLEEYSKSQFDPEQLEEHKFVLPYAWTLVLDLQKIPKKWELVSETWIEMLVHAASQSGGNDHAKQLGRGGEFITHLWFLMAHFGLIEQIDLSSWTGMVLPR